jgi:hypothetical protein
LANRGSVLTKRQVEAPRHGQSGGRSLGENP